MKITEFMELSERERDAFVAREVMGWHLTETRPGSYAWQDGEYIHDDFDTTTWEGMRLVVEKMRDSQFSIRMAFVHRLKEQYIIDARHTIHPEYIVLYLEPNKVCIAALLALGKLEE